MSGSDGFEREADEFARLAENYAQNSKFDMAVFYYTEAVQVLLQVAMTQFSSDQIMKKANEFINKATRLKSLAAEYISKENPMPTSKVDAERAQCLLNEAFDLDGADQNEEALEAYMQAAQLLLELRNTTADATIKSKVEKLAAQAIERAEVLKKACAPSPSTLSPKAPSQPPAARVFPNPFSSSPTPPRRSVAAAETGVGYSREEIEVLKRTSAINGRKYLPFLDIDTKERFAFPVPFTDKDGLLKLSDSQKRSLEGWVRPGDFMSDPQCIILVSSMSIKQTQVQDCSFVASMAVSAQYERRFKKKLITNIIYPQNRAGEAIYNPCGKYMVKFNINGVPRKVIIDDFLPMSRGGSLLCCYSNNKNELWVSLLEKAYMKVMGGYDFPGSNSNIDLHALTGWIPERVAIRLGTVQFNQQKEFKRLLDRHHKGDCLITVATGKMTPDEEERSGLAETHAYAMLDIREIQGHKLFMLKNPWSHMRWKGNFSERDTRNWTPELQKALNYDLEMAKLNDNGVFWIDYDSLCKFYDVIYINWNLDLFPKTYCIHSTWHAKEGPKKDMYNISDNPQFRLEVNASTVCPVWILLTRHITDKDDFANNREFIALVVYKGVTTQRVYYPNDPPPFKDGARINSPHNLVKMIQETPGREVYHLVVSQYEKNNTINYTLRVYSTVDFKLTKIVEPYSVVKQVTGQWKGSSAGGCANNLLTYFNNPTFQIKIDNNNTDNELLIELKAPREYFAGFNLITVAANNSTASGNFIKKDSGSFRQGYVVMEVHQFSGGIYNLIPSTFRPNEEGPFFLVVSSLRPFTIAQIK